MPYSISMSTSLPLDCISTLPLLAPCEHIAGNERFIRKALALQMQHLDNDGRSKVDLTLDLEDGAPVGQEEELRNLFVRLLLSPENLSKQCGIRVHAADSPHCARDLEVILTQAGHLVRYVTLPKVKSVRDVTWCAGLIQHYLSQAGHRNRIPIHALIETSEAICSLDSIASLPQIEALDFGLLDYISQLGGAVRDDCMQSPGQFDHQLLRSVKSAIALAALSHNAIPSHNVTVQFRDPTQVYADALRARHEFGFLRMWSIHPDQIEPIIRAMTPSSDEVALATAILHKAVAAQWGPIEHNGRLHDRASFRYYWGILVRSGKRSL
jgi:citrate lyase subunit beta/citryl-CoA lyase